MGQQVNYPPNNSDSTFHDDTFSAPLSLDADQWLSYQMLPDQFIQRRSASRVWQFWSAMIFVLLAALSGMASAFWAQGHKAQSRNANLVALSRPLNELNRESSLLEHENEVYRKWIQIVESAHPDDSVLQTLLAIAESTEGIQQDVTVRTVEIKLPMEYAGSDEIPQWAKAELVIGATTGKGDAKQRVNEWVSELVKSERIVNLTLQRHSSDDTQSEIEIVGVPRSTKVVP